MLNKHYKNRYDKFIEKIKSLGQRTFTGYTEVHHIQPKCLKGTDSKKNLIRLTLREHFLAHWLLWKSYPNYLPIASAFLQMNHKNSKGNKGFQGRITSRTYETLRSQTYKMISEVNRDKVNVRDENDNLLRISKEEYKNSDYKFHTAGKIYVFNTETNEWVYISAEEYHQNKSKYITRLHNSYSGYGNGTSNPLTCSYNFIDTDTQNIVKLKKADARAINESTGYKRFKQVVNHQIACIDQSGRRVLVSREEYQNIHHTLSHVNQNKLTVFDTETKGTMQITIEEYQSNPNRYLTSTKGKILAKDDTGKTVLVTKEEFKLRGLVGQTKGLRTCLDQETGQYVQITQDEYIKNKTRFVGPNKGKVNAINKLTGERTQIPRDQFDKNIYAGLGNKSLLFLCRNKLTNKEKNINIYEWRLIKDQYEIIDTDKYEKIKNLIK